MESYWLVNFKVFFYDANKNIPVLAEGNSVHWFNSGSFLPGLVLREIEKKSFLKIRSDFPEIVQAKAVICGVFKIDGKGFDDFSGTAESKVSLDIHRFTIKMDIFDDKRNKRAVRRPLV